MYTSYRTLFGNIITALTAPFMITNLLRYSEGSTEPQQKKIELEQAAFTTLRQCSQKRSLQKFKVYSADNILYSSYYGCDSLEQNTRTVLQKK